MSKQIRHAISVVIKNQKGETLFAKRSRQKRSYPLAWSLPSHFVADDEQPQETVSRIGREKLGAELEVGGFLGEGMSDRGDFILFMHVYEAEVSSGEPKIISDDYIELKWANPERQLDSMEIMGDCCRLYKEYLTENRQA